MCPCPSQFFASPILLLLLLDASYQSGESPGVPVRGHGATPDTATLARSQRFVEEILCQGGTAFVDGEMMDAFFGSRYSEVTTQGVSRCHHLWAVSIVGGVFFVFFFILNPWGNDKF